MISAYKHSMWIVFDTLFKRFFMELVDADGLGRKST